MSDQPRRSQLSHYWGPILGAAAQRTGVARAWAIVEAAATAEGRSLPTGGIREMNRLYAMAVKAREATIHPDQITTPRTIVASDIADDIGYRPPQPGEVQHFGARYEHIYTDAEGAEGSEWRFVDFGSVLPDTDAEAASMIEEEAEATQDEYSVTHVGIGRFQLLRM